MKKIIEKQPLKVIAGAPDKPLIIGDIEIPCYVLEGEIRVLSQTGMAKAMNMSAHGGQRITRFVASKSINPFINRELMTAIKNPVVFKNPLGGKGTFGYPARVLVDLCKIVLKSRREKRLDAQQDDIAIRSEILMEGLATVGIDALVDEATGYQEIRGKRALANILEKFIADELQPWSKTFPFDFYAQIFRLKGWDFSPKSRRPAVIGHYTNDFVYARIAPGILKELRKKNPVQSSGSRKHRHHQWFTPDLGHPRLKEHLAVVIALMKISPNWTTFKRHIERALPVQTPQMIFDLDQN